MGRAVIRLAKNDERFSIVSGVARGGGIGQEAVALIAEAGLPGLLEQKRVDVLVDFSQPQATLRFADLASRRKIPIVIGTTGLSPAEKNKIQAFSKKTAVFLSPNFSLGMNLMLQFARRAAASLKDFRPSILEIHHLLKKDAPSGTALKLSAAVRESRSKVEVPIESRREGDSVGDHTLKMEGPFETLELKHHVFSRDAFASGALNAALWVAKKKTGFYDMESMLA